MILETVDFDPCQIIEEVAELMVERAHSKGLALACQLSERIPAVVRGDPVRFHQILLNLLSNAIKFTEHGEVVMSATVVEELETTVLLRCEVRDTGIGVAPELQSRIFDVFSQADGATTRKYGGTGLALARAIRADLAIAAVHLILLTSVGLEDEAPIAQQVGIVCSLSKPARPARLYNCLVAAMQTAVTRPAGEAEPSHAPISEEPHRRGRVLVAEDNVINQVVTGEMLQLLNCQVTIAAHGREALEALTHAAYDLVLMDCQMPEMDGFEATKTFREQERQTGSSHMPIIALTAHALQGDRERCLAAGMDDYLSKPYTFEQLRLLLERWLPGA